MSAYCFEVLKQISDGKFHSGEALAQSLSCSRTAIWQAIHQLQDQFGLTIFSVRGQGYKLAEAFEWLSVPTILAELSEPTRKQYQIELHEQLDSTNTRLLSQAAEGAPHGKVLIAEYQTQGKGRLGRQWRIAFGQGLTFSTLWRFNLGMADLAGLSLAVGIALIRTLKPMGLPVKLKWPNDVLLNEQKLAGILIEVSGDTLGPTAAIIGIGLNIAPPKNIDQPTTGLQHFGVPYSRNQILAKLLDNLHKVLSQFSSQGFKTLKDEWNLASAHHLSSVTLLQANGQTQQGIALGVNEQGALRVETRSGVQLYHAGEISLRTK